MTRVPSPSPTLEVHPRRATGVRTFDDEPPSEGRHEMTATADAAVVVSCLDPACPPSWAAPRRIRKVVDQ